jgi:hypothetical protein
MRRMRSSVWITTLREELLLQAGYETAPFELVGLTPTPDFSQPRDWAAFQLTGDWK